MKCVKEKREEKTKPHEKQPTLKASQIRFRFIAKAKFISSYILHENQLPLFSLFLSLSLFFSSTKQLFPSIVFACAFSCACVCVSSGKISKVKFPFLEEDHDSPTFNWLSSVNPFLSYQITIIQQNIIHAKKCKIVMRSTTSPCICSYMCVCMLRLLYVTIFILLSISLRSVALFLFLLFFFYTLYEMISFSFDYIINWPRFEWAICNPIERESVSRVKERDGAKRKKKINKYQKEKERKREMLNQLAFAYVIYNVVWKCVTTTKSKKRKINRKFHSSTFSCMKS